MVSWSLIFSPLTLLQKWWFRNVNFIKPCSCLKTSTSCRCSQVRLKDNVASVPCILWPLMTCLLHPHYGFNLPCAASEGFWTFLNFHALPVLRFSPIVCIFIWIVVLWVTFPHLSGLHLDLFWFFHTEDSWNHPWRLIFSVTLTTLYFVSSFVTFALGPCYCQKCITLIVSQKQFMVIHTVYTPLTFFN